MSTRVRLSQRAHNQKLWGCSNGCGFTDSEFGVVEEHELTCVYTVEGVDSATTHESDEHKIRGGQDTSGVTTHQHGGQDTRVARVDNTLADGGVLARYDVKLGARATKTAVALPKLTAASKPLGDSKMCTEVLTNEQRQRVFAVFDKIDTDGGGTIDLEARNPVDSDCVDYHAVLRLA